MTSIDCTPEERELLEAFLAEIRHALSRAPAKGRVEIQCTAVVEDRRLAQGQVSPARVHLMFGAVRGGGR